MGGNHVSTVRPGTHVPRDAIHCFVSFRNKDERSKFSTVNLRLKQDRTRPHAHTSRRVYHLNRTLRNASKSREGILGNNRFVVASRTRTLSLPQPGTSIAIGDGHFVVRKMVHCRFAHNCGDTPNDPDEVSRSRAFEVRRRSSFRTRLFRVG